jgi:cysteine desulfurase
VLARIATALPRFGNPSSVHAAGRAARALIEDAREAVAAAIQASPAQIVFTSGGTEANALALRGLAGAGRAVLASTVEHPSVLAHVAETDLIPVDRSGVIDRDALERRLADGPPALVAVMLANNETGVVQPVAEVVAIARRHGALVHCDAVQALGKMPLDFGALGVDSLSLSAHKIGGLKGVGALVLAPGVAPAAQMLGGGQERRRRAGTENTVGIAAFGAAAEEVPDLLHAMPRVRALRDGMEARLRAAAGAAIPGAGAERLGNTTCVALAGAASETQVIALDLAGIAVSAGAACSSGKVAASHVLAAMGEPPEIANCAVRVSLGWDTTPMEIDRFLTAWSAMAARALAAGVPA